MWAGVKGKTENALLAMPFRAAYMFRPGVIQPLNGIKSKTAMYRLLYGLTTPILTVARRFWPQYISTTEELGRAMLVAVKREPRSAWWKPNKLASYCKHSLKSVRLSRPANPKAEFARCHAETRSRVDSAPSFLQCSNLMSRKNLIVPDLWHLTCIRQIFILHRMENHTDATNSNREQPAGNVRSRACQRSRCHASSSQSR